MRRLIWILGLVAACDGGGGGGVTLIDAAPSPVTWDYGPGAAIIMRYVEPGEWAYWK